MQGNVAVNLYRGSEIEIGRGKLVRPVCRHYLLLGSQYWFENTIKAFCTKHVFGFILSLVTKDTITIRLTFPLKHAIFFEYYADIKQCE
jgi:hypothetical protein